MKWKCLCPNCTESREVHEAFARAAKTNKKAKAVKTKRRSKQESV